MLFSIKNSEGSMLVNFLLFGISIAVGMLSSSILLKLMTDCQVYIFAVALILGVNVLKESNQGNSTFKNVWSQCYGELIYKDFYIR